MKKTVRITIGSVLAVLGIVLSILPGSILFLLAGLMILSIDVPIARVWLKKSQKGMTLAARKLDRVLLNRKLGQ